MTLSDALYAVILGVVQGIAEFLPVSSSGHLVICGELIQRWTGRAIDPEGDLRMNIALHIGTLFSILVIYRAELWELRRRPRVVAGIVIATLPLVVIALTPLKDWVEAAFQTPLVAGVGLLVTAALLAVGQRFERDADALDQLTPGGALAVGLFQAVAIVPGISRSGSTISGGLLIGLRREAAAAFSFLIAIPAIGGASVLMAKEVLERPTSLRDWPLWLLGGAVAFAVGLLALRWLIRLITRRRLHWFAWYCAAAGTATIVWQLLERS